MNQDVNIHEAASADVVISSEIQASVKPKRFTFDNRFLAPVLITCILLVGQYTFGFLESYTKTAIAILVSIIAELIIGRMMTGKLPHLASAYISGISVGILVRSPELWPYALCSLIAITSKYVVRVKGRHLWNPSNLGICVLLFLVPDTVASLSIQWGNTLYPMVIVWLLGSMILYRLKRFHISATYVIAFIALSFVRSLITGHAWLAEVAPITGPMYQLFIFFMITDPKTTVQSKRWQCIVVIVVAIVEALLRLNQVIHAPYYALFLVGPAANLIEIFWTSRHRSTSETAVTV